MVVKTDWNINDYYNIEVELNRVEGNISEVANLYNSCGFFPKVKIKTTWDKTSFFDVQNCNRIRQNLHEFRISLNNIYNLTVPTIDESKIQMFAYKQANELETPISRLLEIKKVIEKNILRCGTCRAGNFRIAQKIRRV